MWNYVEQKLQKNLVIQVLPLPTYQFRYSNKMSMKNVTDSRVLIILNRFVPPPTTTIALVDIPTESVDTVVFRFVIVRKRMEPGKYSYALMPNMVISSEREVFTKAPDQVWYEKTTTIGRSEEMKLPLLFEGIQNVSILFQNTFSWDV